MLSSNLLPLAVMVISAGAYFWPQLQQYLPAIFPAPGTPPHKEMESVLNFFVIKKHRAGIESATMTGKLIYDAMSVETPATKTTKSRGKSR